MVAGLIPISSISLLEAKPTDTHNASELIKLKRAKRLFLVKRLLSSSSENHSESKSLRNITKAESTGPAKVPLPTSSIPATNLYPKLVNCFSS